MKQTHGRFSARRKMAAVTRLMREKPWLESGVTVGTLPAWHQSTLDAGLAALKSRPGPGVMNGMERLPQGLGEAVADRYPHQ